MSSAPPVRRGSFLATWRLFASGGPKTALVVLAMAGCIAMGTMGMPDREAISVTVMAIVWMIPFATWSIERQLADRLAFMTLVPQPVPPKWLVLAPVCVGSVAVAAVTAAGGPASIAAAPAVLGCAWWMAGSARWLHRFGLWAWLGWLLVPLAPLAAYAAYRIAGWGPAAAVGMAFGVGALLFQPRAYVGRPLPRPGDPTDAPVPAPTPVARRAASVGGQGGSTLSTAVRFFLVVHETSPALLLSLLPIIAFMTALPISGTALQMFALVAAFIGPGIVGRAFSRETQEFLVAKPLARAPRLVGGAMFPLLIVLLAPAIAACLVNRELFDVGGVLGRVVGRHAPIADDIGYLRDVLGATFIPEKWPAGGLPVELWARLRPLLYMDLARTTCVTLTVFFAVAPFQRTRSADRPPRLNVVLGLVALATVLRLSLAAAALRPLPVPPLWFTALLATVSIVAWVRNTRAVIAPRPATDSSTRG
jgi:hypothetical protein